MGFGRKNTLAKDNSLALPFCSLLLKHGSQRASLKYQERAAENPGKKSPKF